MTVLDWSRHAEPNAARTLIICRWRCWTVVLDCETRLSCRELPSIRNTWMVGIFNKAHRYHATTNLHNHHYTSRLGFFVLSDHYKLPVVPHKTPSGIAEVGYFFYKSQCLSWHVVTQTHASLPWSFSRMCAITFALLHSLAKTCASSQNRQEALLLQRDNTIVW